MIARGRKIRCLFVYGPDSAPCSAVKGILWELQRKVRHFQQSTETFWLHNGSFVNRELVHFSSWRPPMPLPWGFNIPQESLVSTMMKLSFFLYDLLHTYSLNSFCDIIVLYIPGQKNSDCTRSYLTKTQIVLFPIFTFLKAMKETKLDREPNLKSG